MIFKRKKEKGGVLLVAEAALSIRPGIIRSLRGASSSAWRSPGSASFYGMADLVLFFGFPMFRNEGKGERVILSKEFYSERIRQDYHIALLERWKSSSIKSVFQAHNVIIHKYSPPSSMKRAEVESSGRDAGSIGILRFQKDRIRSAGVRDDYPATSTMAYSVAKGVRENVIANAEVLTGRHKKAEEMKESGAIRTDEIYPESGSERSMLVREVLSLRRQKMGESFLLKIKGRSRAFERIHLANRIHRPAGRTGQAGDGVVRKGNDSGSILNFVRKIRIFEENRDGLFHQHVSSGRVPTAPDDRRPLFYKKNDATDRGGGEVKRNSVRENPVFVTATKPAETVKESTTDSVRIETAVRDVLRNLPDYDLSSLSDAIYKKLQKKTFRQMEKRGRL